MRLCFELIWMISPLIKHNWNKRQVTDRNIKGAASATHLFLFTSGDVVN